MGEQKHSVPARDVSRGDFIEGFGRVFYNAVDEDHPWRIIGGQGFEIQVAPLHLLVATPLQPRPNGYSVRGEGPT